MTHGRAWSPEDMAQLRQAIQQGRARGLADFTVLQQLERETGRTLESIRLKAYRAGVLVKGTGQRVTVRHSRHGEHSKPKAAPQPPTPARRCLRCRDRFQPESRFDFVCDPCEGSQAWQHGGAMAV